MNMLRSMLKYTGEKELCSNLFISLMPKSIAKQKKFKAKKAEKIF